MIDSIYLVLKYFGRVLLMAVFCAGPVWILWNWIVPAIFGLPKISLEQAAGLLALAALLFGTVGKD